jgi:hypothetical protein
VRPKLSMMCQSAKQRLRQRLSRKLQVRGCCRQAAALTIVCDEVYGGLRDLAHASANLGSPGVIVGEVTRALVRVGV